MTHKPVTTASARSVRCFPALCQRTRTRSSELESKLESKRRDAQRPRRGHPNRLAVTAVETAAAERRTRATSSSATAVRLPLPTRPLATSYGRSCCRQRRRQRRRAQQRGRGRRWERFSDRADHPGFVFGSDLCRLLLARARICDPRSGCRGSSRTACCGSNLVDPSRSISEFVAQLAAFLHARVRSSSSKPQQEDTHKRTNEQTNEPSIASPSSPSVSATSATACVGSSAAMKSAGS